MNQRERVERRRRLALVARGNELEAMAKPRRRWTGAEIISIQSLSDMNRKAVKLISGPEKPEVVRALEDWLDKE